MFMPFLCLFLNEQQVFIDPRLAKKNHQCKRGVVIGSFQNRWRVSEGNDNHLGTRL